MKSFEPNQESKECSTEETNQVLQNNQNRFGNAFLQEQLNQKSATTNDSETDIEFSFEDVFAPAQLKRNENKRSGSFDLLDNQTSSSASDIEPLISQGEEFLSLSLENTKGLPEKEASNPDTQWMSSFFVDIFHEETNPLIEDATPIASDLYEEIQTCGDEYSEKGELVTRIVGNVQEPEVTRGLVDEPLYIGGKPQAQDIAQGNFGDCYFLAALHQIVLQDPNMIKDNLELSGSTVSFRFQTKSAEGKYQEEKEDEEQQTVQNLLL